jgi:hypothetical protein
MRFLVLYGWKQVGGVWNRVLRRIFVPSRYYIITSKFIYAVHQIVLQLSEEEMGDYSSTHGRIPRSRCRTYGNGSLRRMM